MNILCANCEHQTKRKELMTKHFQRLGFRYDFLTSAYWKDYETHADLLKNLKGAAKTILEVRASQADNSRLNLAALIATWACGMEHIANQNSPTVFCVDDFTPLYHATEFDRLAKRIRNFNVISFWVHTPVGKRLSSKYHREYPELMRGVGGAGDNALLVTPEGATKLLAWMLEYPSCITESMLHRKAEAHAKMDYVDPNHYWIDNTVQKWFKFTEHYTESDTGLTGVPDDPRTV